MSPALSGLPDSVKLTEQGTESHLWHDMFTFWYYTFRNVPNDPITQTVMLKMNSLQLGLLSRFKTMTNSRRSAVAQLVEHNTGDRRVARQQSCFVVSLSKALYPLLSTVSAKEDPSRHVWKKSWLVCKAPKQTRTNANSKGQVCWFDVDLSRLKEWSLHVHLTISFMNMIGSTHYEHLYKYPFMWIHRTKHYLSGLLQCSVWSDISISKQSWLCVSLR